MLIFWLSVGAAAVLLIVGLAIHSRLIEHLRVSHESTWSSLGQPHVVGDAESQRKALAFLSFLFNGKFLALNDPMVTSLSRKLIALNIGLIGCLIAIVVLGLRDGVFK